MLHDYLTVFGATLSSGRFTLAVLRKYMDGRSVFEEEIHTMSEPLEVAAFVNEADPYARLILNVMDNHLFNTIAKARKYHAEAQVFESQPFLSKQIYTESNSDIDSMPNLKSSLVYQFQNSLGASLAVPESLLEHTIKIQFETGEDGRLRPYWPANVKLNAIYEAMLTCLYPLPLLTLESPWESREGVPEIVIQLANAPVDERENLIHQGKANFKKIMRINKDLARNSVASLYEAECDLF